MQVLFESRDPQGVLARPLAVRRLGFALRRLSWLVPRARVLLRLWRRDERRALPAQARCTARELQS